MARRARPGNRAALERALSPVQLAALRECCRDAGLPPDRWHLVDAIAAPWTTVAVRRLARRLEDEGCGADTALLRAAAQCGVSHETVTSRARRWVLRAWSACA